MSETKGLYQVEDEPDDAPQGSVSQPVSALGRADAPLRECPFCGGEAELQHNGARQSGLVYWIWCATEKCLTETDVYEDKSDAIAAWNRRDGEAARVAEAVAAIENEIHEWEETDSDYGRGGVAAFKIALGLIKGCAP
jgi:Lar family restriction alleviation protein